MADAVLRVIVFDIERFSVADNEIVGDGGEDFCADFGGDVWVVVGSVWVVIRSFWICRVWELFWAN